MREQEERAAFTAAIKENPRDPAVRLIFADWLDEHDCPQEADFFRAWTLEAYDRALALLRDFVATLVDYDYMYEDYDRPGLPRQVLTYENLLAAGHNFLTQGHVYCLPMETPTEWQRHDGRRKFWHAFATVTGRMLPEVEYQEQLFSCAC